MLTEKCEIVKKYRVHMDRWNDEFDDLERLVDYLRDNGLGCVSHEGQVLIGERGLATTIDITADIPFVKKRVNLVIRGRINFSPNQYSKAQEIMSLLGIYDPLKYD